ncbi:MAG TPA: DNA-3-methyladenine glycosylase [Holophagaceae bacterium]|nr:DNA-3-methyladenine glycosylase [Holophagaceae bacterium]
MAEIGPLLDESFYQRPVEDVAKALLGQHLAHDEVVLRITEVEAYGGPEDSASHARAGLTKRNAPMWEAGGRVYMYLCYGLHHMLNISAEDQGRGAAILVRAAEPVRGLPRILERRGMVEAKPALLAGPGKVAQALGLDLSFSGQPLFTRGGLELREGGRPAAILAGPRVGIGFAAPRDQAAALRFALAGTRWVTQPRTLAPLRT